MTEYTCGCGAFLFRTDAPFGRLEQVKCPRCHKRSTVYLGGKRSRAEVDTARRALSEAG